MRLCRVAEVKGNEVYLPRQAYAGKCGQYTTWYEGQQPCDKNACLLHRGHRGL